MLGTAEPECYAGVEVAGVTLDSRHVFPGDLYAALPGAHAHGAEFAAGGRRRRRRRRPHRPGRAGERRWPQGLPVLVVDHPRDRLGLIAAWVYGRPADQLLLVGVTGTNGKTTVSFLVEAGLRAAGHVTGLVGTVETRVAGEVVPSERTTPEAPDLQALLALMVERGCTAAAMEVSSHALALGRVDGMGFDVAVFTNLTQDHLDFHPTFEEDYFAAKASLFTGRRSRAAVVNIDDEYGRRLAGRRDRCRARPSPTGGATADWRAEDVVGLVRRQRSGSSDRPASEHRPRCRCPGGSTSPTRWRRSSAVVGRASTRRWRTRGLRRSQACPAGWSASTRASRSSRWSTTRTPRTPSRPCSRRCAS